MDIHTM